jgi:serine/threonine-protein kinase
VSRGIEAMWAKKVVHRDIKPGNVMQGKSGGFKIIDLGVAKHLDEKTITAFGTWCGTWGYMSPEQAIGRGGLTFRSDLFALGILAYEVSSGLHPYNRDQQVIMTVQMPPPLSSVAKVSPEVESLVGRLLQPNAMLRPSRCADVYKVCGGP